MKCIRSKKHTKEMNYINGFLLNKFVPKLYEINEVESILFEAKGEKVIIYI